MLGVKMVSFRKTTDIKTRRLSPQGSCKCETEQNSIHSMTCVPFDTAYTLTQSWVPIRHESMVQIRQPEMIP